MGQNIVFISGLPRSGTSVLHLIIGAHPKYVCVGEAFGLISAESKRLARAEGVRCSCGRIATECEFWGETVRRLKRSTESINSSRYRLFMDAFKEHYGENRIPVDSSKRIEALQALTEIPGLNVRVFYLIRDVRAWTVSLRRQQSRKLRNLPSYQLFLRNISSRLFWRWYLENRRNKDHIKELGVPWLQLSYEELCLFTTLSLRKISEFLDDQFTEEVLSFNKSEHHGILINPMRNDERKMSGVFYDSRWLFNHRQWQLAMALFPNIINYNNREVYRHIDSPFD